MKKIFFLFSLLIVGQNLIAQQDFIIGTSLLGGIPFNKFGENRTVLSSKMTTINIGGTLSLQYRFFNRISLEVGLMQTGDFWKMKDKKFASDNKGYTVKLNTKNYYWSWYGALQYSQPLNDYTSVYGTVGYALNHIGGGGLTQSKSFILTDEIVTVNTFYPGLTRSGFFEAGIQTELGDRSFLMIGLRFNKSFSALATGTYISEKNGQVLRSDAFTSTGNYLALNVGYRLILFHKDHHIRTPKPPKPEKVKREKPVTPVETPPVVADTHKAQLNKKVEGRDLKVSHEIQVAAPTVKILVWDDQEVDGDRVSINLNDQWILEDYTLEKAPREIIATVHEGDNILVLHALNLGKIKPNTAAIIVDDGHKKQKLVLSSDLDQSGTLIINYQKP